MRLIPVVVLMSEETIDRLRPLIDEVMAAIIDAHVGDDRWHFAMRLNGWDIEMMAWGLILRAASEVEMELVVSTDGA